MEIKDDAFYPIEQVMDFVDWSRRKLQRYAQRNEFRLIDNRYLFTGAEIKRVIQIDVNVKTRRQKVSVRTSSRKKVAAPNNVSERIIKLILEIDNDDYVISLLNAIKEKKHLEAMTNEEYFKFVDKLKEANSLAIRVEEYKKEIERMEGYVLDYRNNIEYFKKSLDKRQEETELLLKTIHQRSFIEAKEKKFDKD
jgi:hypothetical protein